MEAAGIWAEEIDPLYDTDINQIQIKEEYAKYFKNTSYKCRDFCEIIHAKEGTEVIACYGDEKGTFHNQTLQ